jgi:hypothetical protein
VRRKTYRNAYEEWEILAAPGPDISPVLMIWTPLKKRWLLEASHDRKTYRKVQTGTGGALLDLVPGIRFWRVRRYGKRARLRDELVVSVRGGFKT